MVFVLTEMGKNISKIFNKWASDNCSVSDFFIVPEVQGNSSVPESDIFTSNKCTKLPNGSHTFVTNKVSSVLESTQPTDGAKTLKLFAVLHRETILYSSNGNNSAPLLSFEFIAKMPVTITLYFFIKDTLSERITQSCLYEFPSVSSFHALSGKQQYTQELPERFPVVLKQLEALKTLDGILPIVIEFVTQQDNRIYYTHCKWNASQNNLQCVKQSLYLHNNIITINSLYGLEVSSSASQDKHSNASSLNALDCVICLNSRSTHVIVPCNHLCICDSCITEFEKKQERCPMCRKYYTSILKLFNSSTKNNSVTETR